MWPCRHLVLKNFVAIPKKLKCIFLRKYTPKSSRLNGLRTHKLWYVTYLHKCFFSNVLKLKIVTASKLLQNNKQITSSSLNNHKITKCLIPEDIHTSPTEGSFSKTPTPLEIPIKLHTFFCFFGLTEAPTPQEIPIPSVGQV